MQSIALLALTACLLTLLLTPAVRAASVAVGWVDRPDQRRKLHREPIPRTGGVAILLPYLLLLALYRPALLPGVALMFGTGLLDDRLNLRPVYKLGGQLAAAAALAAAGVRIAVPGHSAWGVALTVAWLILCANAFNLIDGVDGLAAGLGLTASLTVLAAALLHGDPMLARLAAPLAGCLLAFLCYNRAPASIFLGDSGSLSIGFLLGACAILWSGESAGGVGALAPAMALAVPLLDVGLSIVRRFLRNDPIFAGDRGHLHHRLLDRGLTPRAVTLLLCGAAAVASSLSLLHGPAGALLFAAAAASGVRYLGYPEFRAAVRFLRSWLRPVLGAQVHVEVLERALRAARDIGESWEAIRIAAHALGYGRVDARLGGVRFSTGGRGRECWQMRVNLSGGDYVNVTHFAGGVASPRVLAAFVETLLATCQAVPCQEASRVRSARPRYLETGSPAGYTSAPVSATGAASVP